ncbi:lipase/acyltransferase domain-containing protein [Rubrimonas cliftonensis]|uniref:Lecithin:cholesterol acyltransferase n=1 Tax=Rubrimonas cliftonensis TaxID=89524 RepID=A0A1H3WU23_9RHOB|nr:hypothetical protein [Rubrimonas cliftonensis]SDZ89864.1 Lecithin:cholesterol acyltransferase [Rubrimonas cliftonensis]
MRRTAALLVAASAGLAACGSDPAPPDLTRIYADVAAIDAEARRPVITIPGTLGSRLVDTRSSVTVWGGESRLALEPDTPEALSLLALPIGPEGAALGALRDGVRPDGVVRVARADILGATLSLDVYGGIIRTLIAGGYDFRETRAAEIAERAQNLDAFEFPYDWRRDIVEAAQDLDYFIRRKRAQVEAERRRVLGAASEPVVFDIVAHSMGALVARYYLMYGGQDLPADGGLPPLTWEGVGDVGTVVLIAPPNAGSVIAFENLVNGKSFGFLQPEFPPALIGTHASTYQLLPRLRHGRVRYGDETGPAVDIFDPGLWERFGWGLASPEAAPVLEAVMPDVLDPAVRRARGLAHQRKALARAEQLQAALDRPASFPQGLEAFLVVGGGYLTPATAVVSPEDGAVEIVGFEEGDGVVLRASSLMDERQGYAERREIALRSPISGLASTLLLPSEHVAITQSPVFGDNLLFWLLSASRSEQTLRASVGEGGDAGPVARVARAARAILPPR